MDYVKSSVYNAYCYGYSLVWGETEKFNFDIDLATTKLRASISTIFHQIELKKGRIRENMNRVRQQFLESVYSNTFNESLRLEYSRILCNLQQDELVLHTIQQQVQCIHTIQAQLVLKRNDSQFLDSIMPTIDNLVFASSYESSLHIKLNTFTNCLYFLWGKEYILNPENNRVEIEFRKTLTKIPNIRDHELFCSKFCEETLTIPQAMYRFNPQASNLFSQVA